MSTHLSYTSPVVPFTPTTDQTALRGYFVVNSSGNAAVSASAADLPLGVITDGSPTSGKSAIALSGSGAIAKVKLHSTAGTINPGTFLVLHSDGTAKADPATGARVQVARAIEAGANSALIDAILITPVALS
jgi:hypothetical protein